MERVSKIACCQVVEVLQHAEQELVSKIPIGLRNFLYANRELDYRVNIDFSLDNWEDELESDARSMLALIYRDYLVTKEEQQRLIAEEEAQKLEFFKRRKEMAQETAQAPVEAPAEPEPKKVDLLLEKREPFYKKIWQLLKDIFQKKEP